MQQYSDPVRHVLKMATVAYRTDVGTRALLGYQMRFDLAEGFPCLTTKEVRIGSVIRELSGFSRAIPTTVGYKRKTLRYGMRADEQGELDPYMASSGVFKPDPMAK